VGAAIDGALLAETLNGLVLLALLASRRTEIDGIEDGVVYGINARPWLRAGRQRVRPTPWRGTRGAGSGSDEEFSRSAGIFVHRSSRQPCSTSTDRPRAVAIRGGPSQRFPAGNLAILAGWAAVGGA